MNKETKEIKKAELFENLLPIFSQRDGNYAQTIIEPSKNMLVLPLGLEVGGSTLNFTAVLVAEVEALEETTSSANYLPEDKDDHCHTFEYPTDPPLFCETHVTPDLMNIHFELGPCLSGF